MFLGTFPRFCNWLLMAREAMILQRRIDGSWCMFQEMRANKILMLRSEVSFTTQGNSRNSINLYVRFLSHACLHLETYRYQVLYRVAHIQYWLCHWWVQDSVCEYQQLCNDTKCGNPIWQAVLHIVHQRKIMHVVDFSEAGYFYCNDILQIHL